MLAPLCAEVVPSFPCTWRLARFPHVLLLYGRRRSDAINENVSTGLDVVTLASGSEGSMNSLSSFFLPVPGGDVQVSFPLCFSDTLSLSPRKNSGGAGVKGPGGAGGRARAELARRERALSGHTEQRSRHGSRRYPSHVRANQSVIASFSPKTMENNANGIRCLRGTRERNILNFRVIVVHCIIYNSTRSVWPVDSEV